VDNDTEILLTSQKDAKRVLTESATRAESCIARADRQAAELLNEQRKLATRLLFEHHELALVAREHAEDEAEAMDDESGKKHLARHDTVAERLIELEKRTAAQLLEVENALAVSAADEATNQARTILMDGHYEAAAILLSARMRVQGNEGRR